MEEQEVDKAALAITKAIGYAENGGPPDPNHTRAGKTGELKSIFQYTPATWKAYAKEYLGNPDAALTPDSETEVTLKKVTDLLKEGYSAKQIASEWNSGDKNAYTGKFSTGKSSIGVNEKFGVKYNVPAYADTVNNYAKQFLSQSQQTSEPQQQMRPAQQKQNSNPVVQNLLSIVQAAKQKNSSTLPSQSAPPTSSQSNASNGQLSLPS